MAPSQDSRTVSSAEAGQAAPRWRFSAAEITFFWTVAYPRVIGYAWYHDAVAELEKDPGAFLAARFTAYARETQATAPVYMQLQEQFDKMQVGIAGTLGYEYILHDEGIDLPIPPRPDDVAEVYEQFHFREVAADGIVLPGLNLGNSVDFRGVAPGKTALSLPAGGPQALMNLFGVDGQAKAPLNTLVLGLETYIDLRGADWQWHLLGSHLGAILNKLPRIIANIWFEQERVIRAMHAGGVSTDAVEVEGARRYRQEPREVLEARVEIDLDEHLPIVVGAEGTSACYIASDGLHLPFPKRPSMSELFESWAEGAASNPVFTSSYRCR